MVLEDKSHHAQDQQITVRCPLARPLQTKAIPSFSLRGFTENNKSKMVTVKQKETFRHVSTETAKVLKEQRVFEVKDAFCIFAYVLSLQFNKKKHREL